MFESTVPYLYRLHLTYPHTHTHTPSHFHHVHTPPSPPSIYTHTHSIHHPHTCTLVQAASPFNLRQPFDLMAFMKQEERVSILKELKDELIEYKNEFELLKEFDSFDKSFFANEPKCKDVKLISSYDLYISTVLPLEYKGIRYE